MSGSEGRRGYRPGVVDLGPKGFLVHTARQRFLISLWPARCLSLGPHGVRALTPTLSLVNALLHVAARSPLTGLCGISQQRAPFTDRRARCLDRKGLVSGRWAVIPQAHLERIPERVFRAVAALDCHQFAALRACWHVPGFLDLLEGAPVLAGMATMPGMFGLPMRNQCARLHRWVRWPRRRIATRLGFAEEMASLLGNLPAAAFLPRLLRLWQQHPPFDRLERLRHHAAHLDHNWTALLEPYCQPEAMPGTISEQVIWEVLARDPGAGRALYDIASGISATAQLVRFNGQINTAFQLASFVAALELPWMETATRLAGLARPPDKRALERWRPWTGRVQLTMEDGMPTVPIPAPPSFLNQTRNHLRPVTNLDELTAIGKEMRLCIHDRRVACRFTASLHLSGGAFLLWQQGEERYLAFVIKDEGGAYRLQTFEGAYHAPPPQELRNELTSLLEAGSQTPLATAG